MYIYIYMYIYVCIYVYICMSVCVCVYIYIYIYIAMRKYDTLIHSLGCEKRKQHEELFVDYSSNQERKIAVVETPFLFNSPLLALGDMFMRGTHLVLTMYASTERGGQRP